MKDKNILINKTKESVESMKRILKKKADPK